MTQLIKVMRPKQGTKKNNINIVSDISPYDTYFRIWFKTTPISTTELNGINIY